MNPVYGSSGGLSYTLGAPGATSYTLGSPIGSSLQPFMQSIQAPTLQTYGTTVTTTGLQQPGLMAPNAQAVDCCNLCSGSDSWCAWAHAICGQMSMKTFRYLGMALAVIAAITMGLDIIDIVWTYVNYGKNTQMQGVDIRYQSSNWIYTWISSGVWGGFWCLITGYLAMRYANSYNRALQEKCLAFMLFIAACLAAPAICVLMGLECFMAANIYFSFSYQMLTNDWLKFALPLCCSILGFVMFLIAAAMVLYLCVCSKMTHQFGLNFPSQSTAVNMGSSAIRTQVPAPSANYYSSMPAFSYTTPKLAPTTYSLPSALTTSYTQPSISYAPTSSMSALTPNPAYLRYA